jgi:hypothetical protein|tara:strand:- start:1060 stop:1344 length:285 start_codon:yes stop_codon:yes gene_type:complete
MERSSKITGNKVPKREDTPDDKEDPGKKRVARPPSQKTAPTCPKERKDETGPSKDAGPSMKKGGTVKKTGAIKAHKGEVVLPLDLVKKLQKLMK